MIPYVVATFGASVPYLAGTLWAVRTADGAEMGNALLAVVVPLSLGYVVAVPVLAGLALPRTGVDWDPTGDGVGSWALLVAAGAWDAAVFAVPLFVVAVILALPT
ncbi:MAG: hypothetical protein ABEH78_08580 [Haloferacaceae archaeon]